MSHQDLSIDVAVGIWDTAYTLTRHRDGTGTVRVPWIHWHRNEGTLAFRKHHISAQHMPDVMWFFQNNKTWRMNSRANDCGELEDYLGREL